MFSILIVDDNRSDREGIKGLIEWEKLGVEVVGLAVDGMDGYGEAMRLKPDFILTDVAMPAMDGIRMTQKIKEELPETKFIFMSCFDDFEFLKGAIDLEVYGYILKPVNLSELTDAVRKVKDLRTAELKRGQAEEELRRRIRESMPVLQERFVKDLLYGKLKDENDIRNRMEYLGMDSTCRYYAALFLQIDNYDMLYPDITMEKRHLVIYGVQKCVEDMVLSEITGYITNQHYNSIEVILFLQAEDEEMLGRIIDAANRCKERIHAELSLNVTIGISEFAEDLSVLPEMAGAAEFAVKSKFFSGGNRIIMASEVRLPDSNFQYDIMEIKRKLGALIENGEEKDVAAFVNEYYDMSRRYPATYVKSLTFSIVNLVQTLLFERNESFGSIFGEDLLVWNKLLRMETIVDIKQWLINIIEAVRRFFNRAENSRYQKIVENIKAFISERYAEIENVGQIVEPFYISASHANFIFKQQTGQTIFDYLIIRRMEAAKEMLLDPFAKIYEIAEKTGYKTNTYFASAFKEYTGLTPKQFRDKVVP